MGEKQKDHLGMMATGIAKVVFQVQAKNLSQGNKAKNAKRRLPDAHLWPPHLHIYTNTCTHQKKKKPRKVQNTEGDTHCQLLASIYTHIGKCTLTHTCTHTSTSTYKFKIGLQKK